MLNAFRHLRFSHERGQREPDRRPAVLNAFRHLRFSHLNVQPLRRFPEGAQRLSASEVLAPPAPRPAMPLAKCAQRLSASEVLAPGGDVHETLQTHAVLNAFRHLRFSHRWLRCPPQPALSCAQRLSASEVLARDRFGPVISTTLCAQRLSASEVLALEQVRRPCTGGPCAQRLSASEVLARIGDCAGHRRPEVLNAFRHLRFSHFTPYALVPASKMCAQRLSASEVLAPTGNRATSQTTYACSTPFGI